MAHATQPLVGREGAQREHEEQDGRCQLGVEPRAPGSGCGEAELGVGIGGDDVDRDDAALDRGAIEDQQ